MIIWISYLPTLVISCQINPKQKRFDTIRSQILMNLGMLTSFIDIGKDIKYFCTLKWCLFYSLLNFLEFRGFYQWGEINAISSSNGNKLYFYYTFWKQLVCLWSKEKWEFVSQSLVIATIIVILSNSNRNYQLDLSVSTITYIV